MALNLWILSLVCIFLGYVYADDCPPEQIVRPCRCSNDRVLCENIRGQDIIDGVIRRLGDTKLVDFTLKNSEVDYIPSSIVKKNRLLRIGVVDSTVVKLFESAPSDINRLVQLTLENVTIREGFSVPYLKPLQHLEILLVRDTDIPQLGKDFSLSLSNNIRLVAFLRTKTRSIDYAFVGKPKLQDVRIQNGSLTTLLRASFPYPAPYLETLSFDANEIEVLPADQFELMSKLIRLTLANNKISQVSETIFGTIYDQLQYFILEGNPINCDCSIKWLTERNSSGKTVTGQCVQPPALAGRNIVDLKPSDIPNC